MRCAFAPNDVHNIRSGGQGSQTNIAPPITQPQSLLTHAARAPSAQTTTREPRMPQSDKPHVSLARSAVSSPRYLSIYLIPKCGLMRWKKINCKQVVGAKRDQMGKNPAYKAAGPPARKILTRQSTNPVYNCLFAGWFISLVRTISNGATVHAIKKPAPNAAENSIGSPLGTVPCACVILRGTRLGYELVVMG